MKSIASTLRSASFVFTAWIALMPLLLAAQTNLGTSFCAVYLTSERVNECKAPADQYDDPFKIYITGPRATFVHIHVAGINDTTLPVTPGQVTVYHLRCAYQMGPNEMPQIFKGDSPTKANRGIFIDADDSIAVVAQIIPWDEGDSYAPIPISLWKKEYTIPSANGYTRAAAVAISDSTVLTIEKRNRTIVSQQLLMRGDVYIVVDTTNGVPVFNNEVHLLGNKPFGVVGGGIEDVAAAEDFGSLTEQVPPQGAWGKEFYTMPYTAYPDSVYPFTHRNEFIHLSAVYDSTFYTIDDTIHSRISAGDYHELIMTGFHKITSTMPMLATQFRRSCMAARDSDTFCGPRLTVLPSTSQFLRDVWCISPPDVETSIPQDPLGQKYSNQHFIDVVHPANNIGNFRLDGIPIAGQFRNFSTQTTYVGARIPVSSGIHHLQSSELFGAVCYGFRANLTTKVGPIEAYAFLPGIRELGTLYSVPQTIGTAYCNGSLNAAIWITNLGADTMHIDSVQFIGADNAAFRTAASFPFSLAPQDSLVRDASAATFFPIQFSPLHSGISTATILLYSADASNSPFPIVLTARKDSLMLTVDTAAIDFGTSLACASADTLQHLLANNGSESISIPTPHLARPDIFKIIPETDSFSIQAGKNFSMQIIFQSQSDSLYSDTLVLATPCTVYRIPIRGQRLSPRMSLRGADFGTVCPGDTTTQYCFILNTGDTALTFSEISIAPPFTISPSSITTLPAGASISVPLHFLSATDGMFSGYLHVVAQPCGLVDSVLVTAEQGTPAIAMDSVVFGSVCSGGAISLPFEIRNVGSASANVSSLTIAAPFTATPAPPYVIGAGKSQTIIVKFSPPGAGAYRGNILITASPCAISESTTISGSADSVELSTRGVAFGPVLPPATLTKFVIVENRGATVVHVRSVALAGCTLPCAFALRDSDVTIAAGDSLALPVAYAVSNSSTDSAFVCVVIDAPCADSICIPVTGIATSLPVVNVCADSLAPSVTGENFTMHIRLRDTINAASGQTLSMHVRYDPAVLYFNRATATTCMETGTLLSPGDLFLTFGSCGAPMVPMLLSDISFLGLTTALDTPRSTIVLTDIVLNPPIVIANGCSTSVTLLPICGMHGVEYNGGAALLQNHPNPFSSSTTIDATVPAMEMQTATLIVRDVLGRVVADLSVPLRAAPHAVQMHTEILPTGIYSYILSTGGRQLIREMMLTR